MAPRGGSSDDAATVTGRDAVEGGEVQPFRLGRRPALDGLRAIAILAVIGFHYGPNRVYGGFLGVDVFFVLSGFLITALLVQERSTTGRVSLPGFYARRARRLLPPLAILLVVVAIYGALYPHRPESIDIWRDIAGAALYVANWVHGLQRHFDTHLLSHTWSLAVEEQFYLLWPAALVFLMRRHASRRTIAIVVATLVVASVVDAYLLLNRSGSNMPRVAYGLDTRGSGLLLGCLLGLAVGWQVIPERVRRLARYTTWIGLIILAVAFVTQRYLFVPSNAYRTVIEAPAVADLATVLVVFGVLYAPVTIPARIMSLGVPVWIGRVSYGLYLWHAPIGMAVASESRAMGWGDGITQILRVALTLGVVTLSFYLVEQPILGGHWPPAFPGRRRRGVDHKPAPAGGVTLPAETAGAVVRPMDTSPRP